MTMLYALCSLLLPGVRVAFLATSRFRPLAPLAMSQSNAAPPLTSEKPLKVLLLVEPTPFNYVSGYANRFQEMLKYLKLANDSVKIVTADSDPKPPTQFLDYPISTQRGFELPFYKQVTCTFDFGRTIQRAIQQFKPDIIHCSTPSAIVYPAVLWAYVYDIPLVMSYHTDFVGYARSYAPYPGSTQLATFLIQRFHAQADLVLCTSPQLKEEMESVGIQRIDVWQKGINTEVFNPSFRNGETRNYLSDGHPEAPLLIYVGRLGAEKKLERLKKVLDANPTVRLAIVGKGPAEKEIKEFFKNYPVFFAGQLIGNSLCCF